MRTIRTFVAIPLDPAIARAAAGLMRRLRQPGDGVKWVPADNLHLTLKFLGEVENTEVPGVCEVLREVCAKLPRFDLHFHGVGGFPELQRARVLFAGVEDSSETLSQLVPRLEQRYADLGYKPEPRDYTPHLTLGRIGRRSRRADEAVIQRMLAEQQTELGQMTVATVQVFASFLDKGGPTYQVMDTVTLEQV